VRTSRTPGTRSMRSSSPLEHLMADSRLKSAAAVLDKGDRVRVDAERPCVGSPRKEAAG
jgi:hypothetical protein